jgi:hypothetical protein
VLLSNPLTKCGFRVRHFASGSVVVSLRTGYSKTRAKTSSNQRSGPIAAYGDAGPLLYFAVANGLIGFEEYVRI